MKFNHLNVPDHWEHYWTRYPEGYTILEALISWVSQVDDMADNQNNLNDSVEQFRKDIDEFVGRFDERLQDEVTQILGEWQSSGFLDVVVSEALDTKYHEMDYRLTTQLAQIAINIGSLGAIDESIDSTFDNKPIIDQAISKLPNGGTVILPNGKIFKTSKISLPSNVTLDLNGSTLKLMDNLPDYNNVVDLGGSRLVTNSRIINGTIDGNREKQTQTFFHYGIYLLNVDGVDIDNVEIINCDGEGLFVGYTGFLAKNVYLDKLKFSNNTRNDLAFTNVDGVYCGTIEVDSIAYDSASIDFELQDNTDTIKNVYIDKLIVKSDIQPIKMLTMNFSGVVENININELHLTGSKGLAINEFDNVSIGKIFTTANIEVIGSRNIQIDEIITKGVRGTGLYAYDSSNNRKTENLFLGVIDVSGCGNYGLILQNVQRAIIQKVIANNNAKNGIGLLYGNKDITFIDVEAMDTRSTGKTQQYGMEFQGTNTDITIIRENLMGNVSGDFLNLPSVIHRANKHMYRFISPNGVGSHALEYGNDNTLAWGAFLAAKRISLTGVYDNATDVIPNGSIYEDKNDGKLKYKSQSGVITTLSN